jgi:hypothetical protein
MALSQTHRSGLRCARTLKVRSAIGIGSAPTRAWVPMTTPYVLRRKPIRLSYSGIPGVSGLVSVK